MSTYRPSATPTAAPPVIRSWSDGFSALRRRASDVRGWIELDTDAPDRRWPRTTGLDAIVIAAFTYENADQRYSPDNEAALLIARMAETIVKTWSPAGIRTGEP